MYPQRLPIVDDDDGVWGDILRKYLMKEHYNDDSNNTENGGHKNITIRAGTAGVGGAPLKFASGTLLTAPEIGAMEFAGDHLYITQTSGTLRKRIATYNHDANGATGDIYYRDAGGAFARLAAGTASQILTITGGLPSWQTLSVPASAVTDGAGSGLDADLLDGAEGSQYVRTDASRALTNINNLTFNASTAAEIAPSATALGSAPFGARMWHDVFAFLRNYTWTYETYDGSTWSAQTINKSLFAQKENQQIILVNQDVTNPSQVRWTAQGVAWSQAKWLVIGFTYGATSASKVVTVETSTDGSAWTQRHQSTTTANASVRYFFISDYGGDSYFRITITRNDANRLAMSFISLLTNRSGDQGLGRELESPLDWDGDRNVTVAGSLQVSTATDGSNQVVTTTASQTLTNKTITAPILSGTLTGTYTLGGTPTFPSTVITTTGAQTMTNKRINPRAVTVTQSATPSINTDNGDVFIITGLAQNITSMTSGLSGTPVDGQRIRIGITGTAARTIAWGASYEASSKPLPTTTVSTNRLDTDFIWNAATSKWRVADETAPNVYVSGGTDVTVADGGTGRSTSTTAYGIIAAGTTATGAQQTISPGTAGQFLKSAGASTLGSFANITAADITGTTAQFNAALSDNDFAVDASVVKLTGDQTVAGKKTFSGSNSQLAISNTSSTDGTAAALQLLNPQLNSGIMLTAEVDSGSTTAWLEKTDGSGNYVGDYMMFGTGTIGFANNRLMNIADPTADQDGANKRYVDAKLSRATKQGYNNTGSTIYLQVATFPIDNSANYATVSINGRIGGWVGNESVATWDILLSNRSPSTNGTTITASVYSQGRVTQSLGVIDLVVYGQADKSAIAYFAVPNGQYYTYDVSVTALQATSSHTGNIVTPTGSQIWQLSQDPQIGYQNGILTSANSSTTPWEGASFLALSKGNNNGLKLSSSFDGSLNPVGYIEFTNGSGVGTHNLMQFTTSTIDMQTHRLTNVVNPTGAQDAATKSYVDSAVGAATGVPYDLSIIAFGTYTARVANSYGDFPMGIKIQRTVTFTQVVYRVNIADASGNLVVELRRNGTTVSGTSTTIAAANQVAGGTVTGSWSFSSGDILTVYVTGVGTSPGTGLIADIRGSTS